jgi:hypothetical protein
LNRRHGSLTPKIRQCVRSADYDVDKACLVRLAWRCRDAGSRPRSRMMELLVAAYERAPALLLGLAVLLVLPPLVLFGRALRTRSPQSDPADATRLVRRGGAKDRPVVAASAEEPQWPSAAWIEISGNERRPIGDIVRLGRDADNDICLDDKTVHRYHAAIHRTDDAAYVITDLSRSRGNGVLVNGRRTQEGRLQDGDTIELGQTKLRFISNPA